MRKAFKLEELGCANCAQKMEDAISKIEGINSAKVNFMASKLIIETDANDIEPLLDQAQSICTKYESDCVIVR